MEVAEIYNLIGSCIVSSIPDKKWKSAQLKIEVYIDDYVQFSGSYTSSAGKIIDIDAREFDSEEFESAIYELNQTLTQGGNNRWNKAIFRIWPDNNFDMEFIWDQELDDEIKKNS